jgi:hypothetical protein
VVRALPDVPAPARRSRRPAPRADGRRQPAALHARRPVRHGRRLSRGPPRERAAHPPPRGGGPPGHRPLADPHGRVSRLGRDDGSQPRARLGPGDRARWGDAGWLSAGHVWPHRADAADAPACRHRAGRRVARRPGRDRPQRVHLGLPRRLGGRGRVPGQRLRQRCLPLRRAGPAAGQARRAPRDVRDVLRTRLGPRHVRDGPHGSHAPAGGPCRGRQRGVVRLRGPARDARRVRAARGSERR